MGYVSRNEAQTKARKHYGSLDRDVLAAVAAGRSRGRGDVGGAVSAMSVTSTGKFKLSKNGQYYLPDMGDHQAFEESLRLARLKCKGERLSQVKKMVKGIPKLRLPNIQRKK